MPGISKVKGLIYGPRIGHGWGAESWPL